MRRFSIVLAAVLLVPALSSIGDEPLHVLEPGFRVRALPLSLTNANALSFGPDGKLYALLYDGRVLRLIDTDGDGLEDRAEPFWDRKTFVSPIQMLWAPEGLYVTSLQKLSLLKDDDRDGRADREEIFAQGWPPIFTGENHLDTFGLARDAAGNLYVNIGCANFANAYLLENDKPHYDPKSELGAILRISPDGKSREVFASGFRFCYALEFNRAGDLFATDQEGETWLPGGNPLDELNHVERGRNYGWPPRHPLYLPHSLDTPPVVGFAPQHQSACGLEFDEERPGRKRFGPPSWEGNALVAGFSRGKVFRVELVKTPAGYVGRPRVLMAAGLMLSDLVISPGGSLYLAAHSGPPDWGAGPRGEGRFFRVDLATPETPRPVIAWPSDPMRVRVAYDRPLDAAAIRKLVGQSITFGTYVRAGDRFESLKPPYKAVEIQQAAPRGALRIVAAEAEDEGRTLLLTTDPHPFEAHYSLAIDAGESAGTAELDYSLGGVEATWSEPDAGEPAGIDWWPHLDPAIVRAFTAGSMPHQRSLERLNRPGELTLRSLVTLPAGRATLRLRTNAPIVEAALGGEPVEITDESRQVDLASETDGEPIELNLILRTGVGRDPLALTLAFFTEDDPTERPLPLERLTVPWSPGPAPASATPPPLPPALAGGDPSRGEAVFFSDEAKCSACHKYRGKGGDIGPDLTNLPQRDAASIVRDIQDPSAVLNPDYIPYTVATKDGRVAVGVVRGEGAEAVRILDTNAQAVTIPRNQIADIQPSRTSIMPVGLAGALGEDRLRDLIAFLTSEPKPD